MKFYDINTNLELIKDKILYDHKKILNKGNFILGSEVKKLEKKLSNYVNSKFCICVNSGTDALLICLIALGIKPKDEIIVPAFGWLSAAEVITLLGAKPVFVDVCYEDFNIDTNLIEKKITKKTKAIIPISLFGQPTNFKKINQIAKKFKLKIIDDFAQSFGSSIEGKKSGNLYDLNCTSFFPTKPLGGMGDGGAIFTNNYYLYKKIQAIRNHGQVRKYEHVYLGINSRLDTVNASYLINKLKIFKLNLKKRKEIYQKYIFLLKDIKNIILPKINKKVFSSYSVFTIKVKNRKKLIKKFLKNKIPFSIYYPKPMSRVIKSFQCRFEKFPVAEKLCKEVISLPINERIFKKDYIKKFTNCFQE